MERNEGFWGIVIMGIGIDIYKAVWLFLGYTESVDEVSWQNNVFLGFEELEQLDDF